MTQQGNAWKSKFFAILFTSLVLITLFLSGPAQGFVLSLSSDKTQIDEGETITFTAQIDIPTGDKLPIEYFTLDINGPTDTFCSFDYNGNVLAGCDGITITKDATTSLQKGYGYGYFGGNQYTFGYGYNQLNFVEGIMRFTITLDTNNFAAGDYDSLINTVIAGQTFSQDGNTFTIQSDTPASSNRGGSCLTTWTCSEWSACVDGTQTRTCEKEINYCYAGAQPSIQRSCDVIETLSADTGDSAINLGSNQTDEQNTTLNDTLEAINQVGATITGAVVGITEGEGSALIILLVLSIIVLAGIIIIVHKFYFAAPPAGKFYVYV